MVEIVKDMDTELLIQVEMATWKTMEHMEFISPKNKHL